MDAIWSVRMPEEMKEKVSAMINESGMNSKDFMIQIIQAYELRATKEAQPAIGADIDELDRITARIHAIFVNICERTMYLQMQKDGESETKLKEKQEVIMEYNERIKAYEDNLSSCRCHIGDMENRLSDILGQQANLNNLCETKEALLQEYKKKNEELTGLLEEYIEYKEKINGIYMELQAERDTCRAVRLKLAEAENEIMQLRTRMDLAEKASKADLKLQLELNDIQKEKNILKIRQESQQALAAAQKEYAEKTKELLDIIEKQQTARVQANKPADKKTNNKIPV